MKTEIRAVNRYLHNTRNTTVVPSFLFETPSFIKAVGRLGKVSSRKEEG